jgi:hypothetical protein
MVRATCRGWLIPGVICISVFLAVIDNTIVNVASPRIRQELKASSGQLQWVVDASRWSSPARSHSTTTSLPAVIA